MVLVNQNSDEKISKTIFNWAPTEEQWWITGFNPEFSNPNPQNMVMVCSIDFENEEFYNAFVNYYEPDKETILFDEEFNTIWIMW